MLFSKEKKLSLLSSSSINKLSCPFLIKILSAEYEISGNSFLAAKVIFFNEMFELFNKMQVGENWENFISFISKDDRIGDSHMMVPGHDGRMGFGGACFPKDTSAIMKYAKSLGVDLRILESVIKRNNEIRSTYKKQTDREEEQNINFKNQ